MCDHLKEKECINYFDKVAISKKPQILIYFGCKWICKLSIIVNEIIAFITRILARKKYVTSMIVVGNIKFS